MPLKDGLYRTTRNVTMPHPDRRSTREWSKQPEVLAGAEFIVRTDVMGQEIGAREDRYWGIHSVRTDNREYADFISALEYFEEESIDSVLDRTDLRSRDLLDYLLASGLITVRALDHIARDIREKDLAERIERVREREEKIEKEMNS